MVKAYCLKEKKKNVVVEDPKYELNARGSPVVFGKCASCGNKIYKILSADDIMEAPSDFQRKVAQAKAKRGKAEKNSKKSRKRVSRNKSSGKARNDS